VELEDRPTHTVISPELYFHSTVAIVWPHESRGECVRAQPQRLNVPIAVAFAVIAGDAADHPVRGDSGNRHAIAVAIPFGFHLQEAD
jgi:hypothetical protein